MMAPLCVCTPTVFPVTTECATRRIVFWNASSPVPFLLTTTVRSMTAAAALGDAEDTSTPNSLLEASLSTMVRLSDAPIVDEPITAIPAKLLFAVTSLSTPVTTADPEGVRKIPSPPPLLEAMELDTEKLLEVLGKIKIPTFTKPRMTQFSMPFQDRGGNTLPVA